ncbi:MAG: hypothetical protein MJ041_03235, partial [Acidaminococcaceae bacterium]|nr:hypothetical protein [Acidaminococcaceae bacterium]
MDSTITLNNKVNVDNSKVYGSKNIDISAHTDGYINLANYDYAVSVVFTGAMANTTSTITVDDGVEVTNGSEIRTRKAGSDVSVVAYDDLELYLRSYAEVASGVASGVSTMTKSVLTRNNKISLDGGSTLFSTQDVNLLAGKKNSYNVAEMNMSIQAETFSGGLISLTNDPYVSNSIYQNNQIGIGAGASSQSTRHTTLYAGNGRESIRTVAAYHSLWHPGDEDRGASYVSTTSGNIDEAPIARNNKVMVDGSVTAGIANVVWIDVGTAAGDWVFLDEAEKAMVIAGDHPVWGKGDKEKFIHLKDGDGNDNIEYFKTIGITMDDFILGSENVVETLTKRLEEVGALIDAYKNDNNKAVYNGLVAERDRLEELIKEMGINTSTKGLNSPRRDYIEIPDLVASGGNVVVETGDFNGSGSVTAKGNPSITVNNYTNLALKTGSMVVDDPGGIISFNGKELNPDDASKSMQQQVQELNKGSGAVTLTLAAAKGSTAGIQINGIYNSGLISFKAGTYDLFNNIPAGVDKSTVFFKDGDDKIIDGNGSTVAVKGTDGKWHRGTASGEEVPEATYAGASPKTESIAAGSYDPMADVLVHGNIMAPKGGVSVHTTTKNIIVEGKTAKDAVAISGKIVNLVADNGSITQGFTDGIVNIGGTPEDQYAALYNQAVSDLHDAADGATKEYGLITATIPDGQKAPEPPKDKDGNVIGNWIAGGQVYVNATDININGVIQSGYETFKAEITTAQQQRINDVIDSWKNSGSKHLTDTEVRNNGITYRVIEGGAYWNADKQCYDYVVDVFYNPYTQKLVTADVNANGGRVYLTGRIASTGNGKIICLDGAYNIDISNTLNYGLNLGNMVINDTQGLIRITDSNVEVAKDKMAALVTEIRNGSVTTYNSITKEKVDNPHISGGGRSYVYKPVEGLRYNWMSGYKQTKYSRYTITTMDKWWGAKDGTPSKEQLDAWQSGMEPIETGDVGDAKPREKGIYLSDKSTSTSAGMTVLHGKTSEGVNQYQEGAPRKWSTGYLGCHKWVQYTWRSEEGLTQYDYASVNASNPINIRFIGVAAEDAHVNVTSAQNINVGGIVGNAQLYEVKNADVVTGRIEKGTVNITSENGSVEQTSAAMYGATVNLTAKNNLANIAVTAGDSVNFKGIITDGGFANVVISNNYQAKGNVVLADFGGEKAKGAALTAAGDIHQAADTNLVQASRIDLVSQNGEITGMGDSSMRIKGGQADAVVGSDTMLASVNAHAKGNIDLVQTTGNLRVGTIYSDGGDVTVTVSEGGVIDALPYESRANRISDDELLAQWRQMGMIAGGDTELVDEKKAVLKKVKGGDADYTYWNPDQLLYSIQSKVINPDSGVVTSDKAANFYGRNINLVVRDSVGLNSDRIREVDLSTLGEMDAEGHLTHLEDLKALSTADASTVEWKASEKKAIVRERLAIGLQQTDNPDGKITIIKFNNDDNVQNNIFVESRKAQGLDEAIVQNYDMRLYTAYTTQGDVQFNVWGNLYNVRGEANTPVILGKNIVINTGAEGAGAPLGSIGTKDIPVTIALAGGNLSATATGNIYLNNPSSTPLNIFSMTGGRTGDVFSADGGNIVVDSVGDIYVVRRDSDLQGFIRSNTNGIICLNSEGSIGSADNVVRILNSSFNQGAAGFFTDEGTISLVAGKDIYVEGVSTAEPVVAENYKQKAEGYFNLANLSSGTEGNVQITLNGILNLKNEVNVTGTFTLNINR